MKTKIKEDKNGKVLADFVKYATSHPEQRFWQCLRNWARVYKILIEDNYPESNDIGSNQVVDTFYFEGKNE